jgi:hypothetical protein
VDTSVSHLSETIPEELLDDRELFSVIVLDQDRVIHETEIATKLVTPYEFDASRFLPNATPLTLPGFFEIAASLIADAQTRAGTTGDNQVKLSEEYPPEEFQSFGDELICFRVLKREPANMNTKATGRPQRSSSWYYETYSAKYPNKVIVVESRPIDHIIEFSCWAKTNRLANARALWLEQLFINHAWAFQVKGAERFFWRDRGPDTYMTSNGQRLFYRPINFFLRYREFEVKATPMLTGFTLEVSSPRSLVTTTSDYEQ